MNLRHIAKHTNIRFVAAALAIIMSPEIFVAMLKPSTHPLMVDYRIHVASTYLAHEEELRRSTLIRTVDKNEVKYVSSYFAVPKHHQDLTGNSSWTARAIFNGKKLSKEFETPAPVNLAKIPTMLKIISELHIECAARQGKPCIRPTVISADLRHWFHQFRLHHYVANYFCIHFSTFVAWTCLPMGWSWSTAMF
jgi:hypothetical protein